MKSLVESILDDDFEDKINGAAELLVRDKFKIMSISFANSFTSEYVDHAHMSEVFKRTLWTEIKKQGWELPDADQMIKSKKISATWLYIGGEAFEEVIPFIKVVMHMPLLGWMQNFTSFLRNYLKSGWKIVLDEKSSSYKSSTGSERIYINFYGPKGLDYDLYISLSLRDKTKKP